MSGPGTDGSADGAETADCTGSAGSRDTDGAAELRSEVIHWIRDPVEGGFDSLALRVLRYQAVANPVYCALLRARGLDPRGLDRWEAFPPIPARAFREFPVYCGPPGSEEARFLTSGTTTDRSRRGVHRVRDLELYRAALLGQGRRYLRPGTSSDRSDPTDRESLRVISLLPSPAHRPDSSLVHMAGVFHAEWDDGGGRFLADPEWTIDAEGFRACLMTAVEDEVPLLLIGTAFAWVHWLDHLGGPGSRLQGITALPRGSCLMETGGFKGRSRTVPREELYQALSTSLGISEGRIVNEYGMTELLSQFYEPVLLPGGTAPSLADRHHEGPDWVRTRVLDPVTLEPAGEGEPGLLCHLDLANLFSAAHVLTEDLGVSVETGARSGSAFRLLGRMPGAEARGCSLVMEELLEEAGG